MKQIDLDEHIESLTPNEWATLTDRQAFWVQGLINRARATRAALAEAEAKIAKWLPIETAPKDGRAFIVLLANGNIATAFYNERLGSWQQRRGTGRVKPSHWLPLTPPEAQSESL